MSSLLTVEDYNSVNTNYIHEYYVLDTSNVSLQSFENIIYDFTFVSYTEGSLNSYVFDIHNSLWTKKFYCLDNEGNYIKESEIGYQYNDGKLLITVGSGTVDSGIKLVLLLSNYIPKSEIVEYLDVKLLSEPVVYCTQKQIDTDGSEYTSLYLPTNEEEDIPFVYKKGVIDDLVVCSVIKTDLEFDLSETSVTVGYVNKIKLNVNEDYLDSNLDIIINYNNQNISAEYDAGLNDYCFDLDLTEKLDSKPIRLTVQVNENEVVNSSITEVSLTCNYPTANSFTELQSQIVAGAEIIQLTDTIFFENRLIIPHDIYIIGNENAIELGKYHVIISDNVNVKFEGGKFFNGEPCFIQKPDSILTLTGCNFVNAKITNNYKGSVVSSNNTSSITNITNCSFHNCHHTIYTGSELSVTNCKSLYDDWNDSLDTDYSAFINAFDGIITVTGSICDIDYADKIIDNEEINYALSLIGLSNECTFNNVAANQLSDNDVLPFFGNFYNNRAHVFVPFYHDTVEDVVVASPILGKEDQSVCHRILGTDWVYKNNTQITRVDGANTIRKINWEDM